VTAAAVLPRRGQRRRSPVHFDDVVRPELRRGTGEVLERRVYRLDAPPASSPSSDPQ
jgi:hypothetical protein